MNNGPKIPWHGASGREYEFDIFALPCTMKPNLLGNYIFTKRAGDRWIAIYIGQGDLSDRVNEGQNDDCIQSKGATHVHARVMSGGEEARRSVEQDLLDYNTG